MTRVRSLSCGASPTMTPTTKPPKTAWMPIHWVKLAPKSARSTMSESTRRGPLWWSAWSRTTRRPSSGRADEQRDGDEAHA